MFFGQSAETKKRGLVICAFLVADSAREEVISLLPRDHSSGQFLKASSRTTNDTTVALFLTTLLTQGLDFGACLISLDVDDPGNLFNVVDATRYANFNRSSKSMRPLGRTDMAYWLFYPKALLEITRISWIRRRERPNHLEVVFDSEQIEAYLGTEIAESLQESFAQQGIDFDLEWRNEQADPMLNAPDLLAGALLRHYRRGDCGITYRILESGNGEHISMPRTVEILALPSTEELDDMGA
jgi:hypothetical protein